MRLSVVLSTYNQPDWLEKVLIGYCCQSHSDFEIVVADDGSTSDTKARIDTVRAATGMRIRHVHHADDGFRKTIILNKAICASAGDYLIFSDGDCIPRRDFVGVHATLAQQRWFVSGGYCKVPLDVSRQIAREDILSGDFIRPEWLGARSVRQFRTLLKLGVRGRLARHLNAITTTRPTWNGHNASGWKSDILGVNGFDERMTYGGEDREMGERLDNAGVKGRQIRYSAVCVHLDHGRPWRTPDALAACASIRRTTREESQTWTEYGIERREG